MKTSMMTLTCLAVASLAGTAHAQSSVEYASGLRHEALGGAQLGPVNGRRLPVHNLGSSGEDGVEVKLFSDYGGTAAVDVNPLLHTPGAELRIKYRGWDGLIYGTHRLVSHGDGTGTEVFDFSGLGAATIHVERFDATGTLVSDEHLPGPIIAIETVPDWFCDDGSTPEYWQGWTQGCPTCPLVWMTGWICPNSGTVHAFDQMRLKVTPDLPVGAPSLPGTESMMITAKGVPSIDVSEASITTFGVQSWGLGQAVLEEECDGGGGCPTELRRLKSSGIGSSGNDGVSVAFGPGNGATTITLARGKGGWDLKSNPKFYDDEGTEILRVIRSQDPGTGQPTMGLDFSGMGAIGSIVTYFDPNGNPLGNGFVINYDPTIGVVLCPQGSREVWEQGADNLWHFVGCTTINNMVLPDGTTIGPVASMSFEPVGGEFHRVAGCTVTGSDVCGDIIVQTLSSEPECYADFDHTGFVDLEDFFAFVHAFEEGTDNADFDHSGFVDLEDYFAFVHAFEQGC